MFHAFAVSTRGDTQQPLFLLVVRCQCRKKKMSRPVHKGWGGVGEGGRVYNEESVGRGTRDGERLLEDMCAFKP